MKKNRIDRLFVYNHCLSLPLQEAELTKVNNLNKAKILCWIGTFFQKDIKTFKIECLRVTGKSQVYKVVVNSHDNFIFKLFASKKSFLNEHLAFILFEGEGFIPQLIDSCEDSLYLIMEYLPRPLSIKYNPYLENIARNLGIFHSYGTACAKLLNKLFPNKTEKQFLDRIKYFNWIEEKKYFEKALLLSIKYYGEKRVPLMIGDIKPEHVLLRGNKECVFIDMETFSVGFPDYLDLLSLVNFNPNNKQFTKCQWMWILEKYLEGKTLRRPREDEICVNYEILSLIAKSLGYHEMFEE